MSSITRKILSGLSAGLAIALVAGGCAYITPPSTLATDDVRQSKMYFGLASAGADCIYGAHDLTITSADKRMHYEFCANSNFQAAKRLTSCLIDSAPVGEMDKQWCRTSAPMLARDFEGANWLLIECNNHDDQHEVRMENGVWVGVCDDHIAGEPEPALKRIRE